MYIKRLLSALSVMLFAVTLTTPIAKAELTEAEKQEMASLEIELDSLSKAEKEIEMLPSAVRLLELRRAQTGADGCDYAKALLFVADGYLGLGDGKTSLEYSSEAADIYKRHLGEETPEYANALHSMGYGALIMGDIARSLEINEQAYAIRLKAFGQYNVKTGSSLYMIATCYLYSGKVNEALEKILATKEIIEVDPGPESYEYGALLSFIANMYTTFGDYANAVKTCEEAVEIITKIKGEEDQNSMMALSSLSVCYGNVGDYAKAINLAEKTVALQRSILGPSHPDVAKSLDHLIVYYNGCGQYFKAIDCMSEAIEILKSNYGDDYPGLAWAYSGISKTFDELSDYDSAIEYSLKALELFERQYGHESTNYATALANLSGYYWNKGEYSKGLDCAQQALDINERILGREHPEYAVTLHNMAIYNYDLGNYSKAKALINEALEITAEELSEFHPNYLSMLPLKASILAKENDIEGSIDVFREALDLIKMVRGEKHPDLANTLNSLAGCYSEIQDYDKALSCLYEAADICAEANGTQSLIYAVTIQNIGAMHLAKKDFEAAHSMNCKAYEIMQSINVVDSHQIISAFEAVVCSGTPFFVELRNNGDSRAPAELKKIEENAEALVNLLARNVRNTFSFLTSNERSLFWDKNEDIFFDLMPLLVSEVGTSSIAQTAYNAALLSKGILLNTDAEFNRLLKNSGDLEALDLYHNMVNIMRQIDLEMGKPMAERTLDVDSLRAVAHSLEKALIGRSQQFGDYTRSFDIDWRQVQSGLTAKDAAVEFVSNERSDGEVEYFALVLTNDAAPRIVKLFTETELYDGGDVYSSKTLSSKIWKPIVDVLKGRKNIYFSPVGKLYGIAIESLPDWKGKGLICNRFNLRRLSSTRELAMHHGDAGNMTYAALFGGISYDADLSSSNAVGDGVGENAFVMDDPVDLYRYFDRGSVAYLPGTLDEVSYISSKLGALNREHSLLTGEAGTESAFKGLSGKPVGLLHIATHGFYWDEKEAKMHRNLGFIRTSNESTLVEDKAMARSGLLLAGANHTFKGKNAGDAVDDGVLTAKEIAALDLNNLDLVVLSACQTGLGEINGDGVFGLQRGFKKAGARSIMMSLWKVDDAATQLLMQNFYDNLLAGDSKADALRKAQSILRTANSGRYADPKYWAAFILLD